MTALLNYIGLYELERERERERTVTHLLRISANKFKVVENTNLFMFAISYDK